MASGIITTASMAFACTPVLSCVLQKLFNRGRVNLMSALHFDVTDMYEWCRNHSGSTVALGLAYLDVLPDRIIDLMPGTFRTGLCCSGKTLKESFYRHWYDRFDGHWLVHELQRKRVYVENSDLYWELYNKYAFCLVCGEMNLSADDYRKRDCVFWSRQFMLCPGCQYDCW